MWSSLFLSLLKGTTIWSVLQTRTLENSQISSVQSLSHVQLFGTPWMAARQASLSIAYSQSLLRLMSIELVMPSNHLILCHPLLLLPSIFPSIRVFSNESVLCIRWPNPSKKKKKKKKNQTKKTKPQLIIPSKNTFCIFAFFLFPLFLHLVQSTLFLTRANEVFHNWVP